MNKTMAKIVALVCTVGTLFLVFQVRFVKPEEGGRKIIYTVPGQSHVGSSAGQDLQAQLMEVYGEPHTELEIGTAMHLGQEMPVLETVEYVFDFLGQSFQGDRYIFCQVKSLRTVEDDQEPIHASRLATYMACDPADDGRAEVLWDTVQIRYESSQESFDSLGN